LQLPLGAEDALFAAELWPHPSIGPARLDGGALYYDARRSDWEREVWLLVCGELLRRAGRSAEPAACLRLASAFGAFSPARTRTCTRPRRVKRRA
jgi:hypothetical protein